MIIEVVVGPKGLAESGWELFDVAKGSERKLLHAIGREQGNAQAGYVEDSNPVHDSSRR